MKKILNSKTIPYIVIGGSVVGLLLRLWTLGTGADAFGLYPRNPLAWVLLWLLTAAVISAVVVAIRPLKKSGNYHENYPKSVPGMIGYVLAGGCFIMSGINQLGNLTGITDQVAAIAGLIAGAVMLVLGVLRLLGKKPNFLLHGLICLYFAIRLFNQCQLWSNEPQTGIIIMPFLGTMCLLLSAYQRICFDVGLGHRRVMLFWSLLATYFCIVAVLSFREIAYYAACALWQMTNLCSLRPDKKKKPEQVVEANAPDLSMEEPETPEEE